ncbi:MAG: hypothetical protein NTX13_07460 [Acidobacteria bacterium]|nr:hypothetical protein [Acidobacteriota bacterium]
MVPGSLGLAAGAEAAWESLYVRDRPVERAWVTNVPTLVKRPVGGELM